MKTEILCILDRSGSMISMAEEAVNGLNRFLREQKRLPGQARISIILFDDQYEELRWREPLEQVSPMTHAQLAPRGMTALYDALGAAIQDLGDSLSGTPEAERPDKVLVCVLTDGAENASKHFSHAKVAEMIAHQQDKYSWEFIFLATNMDAFAVGGSLNIPAHNTVQYDPSGAGMTRAYGIMGQSISSYRTEDSE